MTFKNTHPWTRPEPWAVHNNNKTGPNQPVWSPAHVEEHQCGQRIQIHWFNNMQCFLYYYIENIIFVYIENNLTSMPWHTQFKYTWHQRPVCLISVNTVHVYSGMVCVRCKNHLYQNISSLLFKATDRKTEDRNQTQRLYRSSWQSIQ